MLLYLPIRHCFVHAIINQGLLCRHQYRIFIQSNKATFHISLLHTRWFNSIPSNITNFITITKRERSSINILLTYINQLRSSNIYMPVIREQVNKKAKFGIAMFMAKTSIQVTIIEDVIVELIEMLT